MKYNIRRRERKDCKDIEHVVTKSWNETYKGIVPDEFLDNLYKTEEMRVKNTFDSFNDNDNHQFVLEVNDKVVGFINVGKADNIEYYNCGEIYALYILNEYKGNGFGKKLVEMGINEIRKMGFDKMIIGCLEDNPSNEFYKHIGGIFVKTRVFEKLNMIENIYLFEEI